MRGLSGTSQPKQPTSCREVWLGGNYATVRLVNDVDAVSVRVGGRPPATAAGRPGPWFAVGDVILTGSAYTHSRSLQTGFSTVDWCILKAGSIVNIGRCSPLFGHLRGGEQVEWVSGPRPEQVSAPGRTS